METAMSAVISVSVLTWILFLPVCLYLFSSRMKYPPWISRMFKATDGRDVYFFLPRDDDCFRPARIMEGGQMFEFGGMCREMMDRVAPTAFSLSAQQMQSTGDQHIPSHFNSSWLQLSLCYTFILYWSWSFAMHKKNRLLSEFQIPLCKGCMSKGLTALCCLPFRTQRSLRSVWGL